MTLADFLHAFQDITGVCHILTLAGARKEPTCMENQGTGLGMENQENFSVTIEEHPFQNNLGCYF